MGLFADLIALVVAASFVFGAIGIFVSFEKRSIRELRERALDFLTEGEINMLTYQNANLPPLDQRIWNYYTEEDLTPELFEYIENNFMRVMREKLEGIEESKRPRFNTPYRDSQMTLQEIEQIVKHSLNIIKNKVNKNTQQATGAQ